MATRKTKRYDDGGDVLGRLMGGAPPSSYDGPGRDTNGPEPIERAPNMRLPEVDPGERIPNMLPPMDDPIDRIPRMRPPRDNGIGPRDTGYMDEPPIKSGNNDALGTMAGQLTKAIGGSARGAGDGIPLGQRIGTADDGIPAMNVPDAKTALQNVAAKKAARDAMVEDMISGMSRKPQVAKIKSSYGGMGGFAKGGSVSKASSRADGIAQRGKTRGKMC